MERTYESAAALVGRAAGPLASHLDPFVTVDRDHADLFLYFDADLELKQRILDLVTPLNGRPERYRPDDKLLAFLRSL